MEPRTYGWEPGSRTPLLSFTLVMAPVNVSTLQQSIELIQNQYGYFFSSESVDLIGLHVTPLHPTLRPHRGQAKARDRGPLRAGAH